MGKLTKAEFEEKYMGNFGDDPEPLSYPPETVLTFAQLCEWLQISRRMGERLNIKPIFLGTRTRRYLAKDVLAYLEKKKEIAA